MSQKSIPLIDTAHSPYTRLQSVSLTNVTLEDEFWASRRRTLSAVTLPSQYRYLDETGRLANFERAAGKTDGSFQGLYFNDSDVYKWLEAAAWSLAQEGNPGLQYQVEAVIDLIASAQRPDGYLNTYFARERADERWTNLREKHELYCAGHLFQAAVAHFRVTGSIRLLEVARRYADHIDETFGPHGRPGTPGHPEVEMALVELYRVTGESRYLELARSFLDNRGQGLIGGSEYLLDHTPFRQMERLTGHAVRALYLCAGATDIYLEDGDVSLREALERLWQRMVSRQIYINGGLGARHDGEAFGADYELPNARAYAETCAAIASVMWSWRMLQSNGDAHQADLLEWTLYNAILPGISLDGNQYFYVNPLESDGSQRRQPWYDCACCPPNLARFLATVPAYFYSTSTEGVWVHLYAQGQADLRLPSGEWVVLKQRTRYPWEGKIEFQVIPQSKSSGGEFILYLRVPGWVRSGRATLTVNGVKVENAVQPGSYYQLNRFWKAGDTVQLDLPMPVELVHSHPYVLENYGRVAITRGPLLYCAEAEDNPGMGLKDVVIPSGSKPVAEYEPELLGGMVRVQMASKICRIDPRWSYKLYRTNRPSSILYSHNMQKLHLIPYFAWANREPGAMQVWFSFLE